MNRSARITAGIILVVIGIAALLHYTIGKGKSEYYEHTVPLGDEVREIRIDGGNLDLNVRFMTIASGDNAVRIEGKASSRIANRIQSATIENGVLHLQFNESWRWQWGFSILQGMSGKQTITIELTDEAMQALGAFRASVESGSLHVNGAAARESVITSDSGSIRIDTLRSDIATVQTDSGSIRLERFEGGKLSLRSDSGSIRAETVSASLNAASDSGSIRIGHLAGYGAVKTDSGSVHIVKDDGSGLDITSDSGSVRITVPAAFSGIYDLRSNSGAISHPDRSGTSGEVIRVRTDSGSIQIEQQD